MPKQEELNVDSNQEKCRIRNYLDFGLLMDFFFKNILTKNTLSVKAVALVPLPGSPRLLLLLPDKVCLSAQTANSCSVSAIDHQFNHVQSGEL